MNQAKDTSRLLAEGQEEAARANDLRGRQRRAASRVRERYEPKIAAASWPRKIQLRLQMRAEIRREKARIEREVAPREGLYLLHALAQGEREIQQGKGISDAEADAHFRARLEARGARPEP